MVQLENKTIGDIHFAEAVWAAIKFEFAKHFDEDDVIATQTALQTMKSLPLGVFEPSERKIIAKMIKELVPPSQPKDELLQEMQG